MSRIIITIIAFRYTITLGVTLGMFCYFLYHLIGVEHTPEVLSLWEAIKSIMSLLLIVWVSFKSSREVSLAYVIGDKVLYGELVLDAKGNLAHKDGTIFLEKETI